MTKQDPEHSPSYILTVSEKIISSDENVKQESDLESGISKPKIKERVIYGVLLRILVILTAGLVLGAVSISNMDSNEHEIAKRATDKRFIYHNALVYTVAGDNWVQNTHQAIVTEGKNIIYIGTNNRAEQMKRPGDAMINLYGSVILPGFHDVHMHPMEAWSLAGGSCVTINPADDLEKIGRQIAQADCSQTINGDWVVGHGHSIYKVLEHLNTAGARDPRLILDEAIPDRPVIIMEETSHSMWVNSLALQRAGMTATSGDVIGGVVWRNPDNGNKPNGILLENAGDYVMDLAMRTNPAVYRANYEGLKGALGVIRKNGITSIVDARVYVDRGNLQVWLDLYQNEPESFTVRAVLDLWAAPQNEDNTQIQTLKSLYSNDENSLLRISQIKLYIDGLLHTTTAAVLQPYLVNFGFPVIEDENKGLNYFTQERLTKYMKELQNFDNGRKGFDFHVHAIGDRGVREVLNAIEASRPFQNTNRPSRHRLTHLEMVDQQDYSRFKQLGAIADFQVAGDFALPKPYNVEELNILIGQQRAQNYIPVKDVANTGAHVTLSSDWDVSSLNPFIGLANAINRGAQSVSIKQAIEMYTISAAYVMRQENKVGSLEVGKEADFIIIDTDVVGNTGGIRQTQVLETVLQGESVFIHPDILKYGYFGYYWY